MLEFPCVHEITARCGKGHYGVAILARSGDKTPPRHAILQPPIEEVTKDHDGITYVYASLVAIFVIKCSKNGVDLKIRYEDTASDYYMVSADTFRVYQDPDTRIPDQPQLVGKKWRSGYVYDAFNATEADKPAPCRNWNEFPESSPLTTNDYGDFQMHSEPGIDGWALCEDDRVRVGPDINKEVEMQNSEVVPMWQSLLINLGYFLENLAYHDISSLKTIVGLYLSTCTPAN